MIVAVLIFILIGFLAMQLLSRLADANRAGDQVATNLTTLAEAIEQYVATSGRLPCPADPTLPTTNQAWGDEAVPSPNLGACTVPFGSVPWRTIGARQESAVDSWGWKVSYRVFSGTDGIAGSLTQDGGVTMVKCDTFDPSAGNTTPVAGVAGGLCVPIPDPTGDTTLRSTRSSVFLANKGLTLTDNSPPAKTDIAFVLISHGPTGMGSFTTAGLRNAMPAAGDELNNTNATGPFLIKAFSAAATDPMAAMHFDDRLVYRSLSELVRRTNLAARNWPEPVAAGTTGVVFNQATVEAAAGQSVAAGSSTGSVTLNFPGVVATATGGDISFDNAGGYGGIGVFGGGSALLQSSAAELVTLQVSPSTNTKFAVTLGDFGRYSGTFYEFVQIAFYLGASNVANKLAFGCRDDGGLASILIDVGSDFDRVVIRPLPAFDAATSTFSGETSLLVSEVSTCPASAAACVTSLTDFGNICTAF